MTTMQRLVSWAVSFPLLVPSSVAAPADDFAPGGDPPLTSPDGRIQVSLEWPAPETLDRPRWSLTMRGQKVLSGCGLGLRTADRGELMAGARVAVQERRSMSERVRLPFGKADHVEDHFREVRYRLESPTGHPADLIFRCYNDAVALRYELPAWTDAASVTILDETTSFHLEGNPLAQVQYLEHFRTSHEHEVIPTRYREIRTNALLDLPLTFTWNDGLCLAITEAALRHYAGMSLLRPGGAADASELVVQLTPRPDGARVVRPLPMRTPWRVILIGDRLGALLESRTIYALNEPSRIGDPSWIKPGKLTFHWWNGDVYDGRPGPPILSLEMARKYIDFCAANGIAFHALTSTETTTTPWYRQSHPGVEPGPDTDVTEPRASFDLAAIRRYAESRGVRLWTWVHQAALRGRVEEAFAAFERLGWSGMMVDFFDHDDQESVEFAEAVLAAGLATGS